MFGIDTTRLKTALALVGGLFLILLIDSIYIYWILFAVLLVLSIVEIKSFYYIEDSDISLYVMVATIAIISFFANKAHYVTAIMIIIYASYGAYKNNINTPILKALIYPILPLSFFFSLISEYGMNHLIWVILVVAASDTGAYVVGKNIGKTKFSSSSPNKTLEGLLGGLAIGSIVGSLYGDFFVDIFLEAFILSIAISLLSIFGDLYESYLKRQSNLDDSGDILPGHGGILDRLDGFLFALPVFYMLLEILEK